MSFFSPFKRVEFCIATIDLHLEACDQRNPLDQRNPIKIRAFRGKQVGYETDLPDAKNRTSVAIVVLANEAEPPQNWQQTIHPVGGGILNRFTLFENKRNHNSWHWHILSQRTELHRFMKCVQAT